MIASVCNAIWNFSKKGVVLELPLFSSNVISLRGFLLHRYPNNMKYIDTWEFRQWQEREGAIAKV